MQRNKPVLQLINRINKSFDVRLNILYNLYATFTGEKSIKKLIVFFTHFSLQTSSSVIDHY